MHTTFYRRKIEHWAYVCRWCRCQTMRERNVKGHTYFVCTHCGRSVVRHKQVNPLLR